MTPFEQHGWNKDTRFVVTDVDISYHNFNPGTVVCLERDNNQEEPLFYDVDNPWHTQYLILNRHIKPEEPAEEVDKMIRGIRIHQAAPCAVSARILADTLKEKGFANTKRIKLEGSRYEGSVNHLVVNYGSSTCPDYGDSIVLNSGVAVATASNKVRSFDLLKDVGISIPEFVKTREEALPWLEGDGRVFCRQKLTGHSGEGIVVATTAEEMVDAPLYVKGLPERHREYRVHVFGEKAILVQQKKRRRDHEGEVNDDVRNHGGGWIYAVNDITPLKQDALDNAIRAVAALGLDFGAVDVVTNGDSSWVLEVNTAPGLSGESSVNELSQAIMEFVEESNNGNA